MRGEVADLPHLASEFPGDSEESKFWEFVGGHPIAPVAFEDPLYARIRDALDSAGSTALDLAVLIRQALRRASERDGRAFHRTISQRLGCSPEDLARVGVTAIPAEGDRWLVDAQPWQPLWIESVNGLAVDEASIAGTQAGERTRLGSLRSDPFRDGSLPVRRSHRFRCRLGPDLSRSIRGGGLSMRIVGRTK
jgi:hypothetical protein